MKRLLSLPFMAVMVSLSGCALAVLNAVSLVAIVSNTMLYPYGEHKVPTELGQAITLDFHREFWRADGNGKCTFSGVLLPYDQTWPEEVVDGDGNKTTLPQNQGKLQRTSPSSTTRHAPQPSRKVCYWLASKGLNPPHSWAIAAVEKLTKECFHLSGI